MSGQEIIALVTGTPAVLAAITALIYAIRGKNAATTAQEVAQCANNAVAAHVADHVFPIQSPTPTEIPPHV